MKIMQNRSSKCVKAFEQINVYGAFSAFVVHNFFRKNLFFMMEHFVAHLKDHRGPLVGRGPSLEKRCDYRQNLIDLLAGLYKESIL